MSVFISVLLLFMNVFSILAYDGLGFDYIFLSLHILYLFLFL